MEHSTILQQRIKAMVEHGHLYPQDPPVTVPLAIKLTALVLILNLVNVALNVIHILRMG